MGVVFIALSTALLVLWIMLFVSVSPQDIVKLNVEKIYLNSCEINKGKKKVLDMRKKFDEASKASRFVQGIFYSEKSKLKEIKRLISREENLKKGKLELLDLIPVMGYNVLSRLSIDSSTSNIFNKFVKQNSEITGKDTAIEHTRYQISCAISYVIFGIGITFDLVATFVSGGKIQEGLMLGIVGSVLIFLLAYLPLDGLKEQVEKKQDAIISDFPQAVSKLTLLVGAGIDVTQAWQQTAASSDRILYKEMQTVIDEMNNGISPYESYNGFIHRCNNKYTSKLATSIMQNLSKGNDEICKLLVEITSESWSDRRQYAKRKGELAQSKLLLPIMLMFVGIILLVMAPVMSSFGNMGL